MHIAHTAWFKPLLGMKKSLQHAFVEQHVTHWLRNDDVDHLWKLNLFDLARDYADAVGQQVALY